jgi:hypothetical protein
LQFETKKPPEGGLSAAQIEAEKIGRRAGGRTTQKEFTQEPYTRTLRLQGHFPRTMFPRRLDSQKL